MKLIKPIVLASQSPRRIHLLQQIGWNPIIIPCDIPEVFDSRQTPGENAETLALQKARCVGRQVDNGIVIGADTIVVLNGSMLGKPNDPDDAVRMLSLLSGKTHTVYTGIALLDRPSDRHLTDIERTEVTFRELPAEEMEEYAASGSPLDKAGAYGIQDDYGAVFVTRIEGCFYNVVGLPLSRLYSRMIDFQRLLTR